MKTILRSNLLAASCLLLLPAVLLAQPKEKPAPPKPSKSETVSYYFNRSRAEIDSLREAGYGYGEIVKIFVIAEMSRKPLPELLAENRKGYGWGAISLKLGLHAVFVKKRVDSARSELDIRVRPAPRKDAAKAALPV